MGSLETQPARLLISTPLTEDLSSLLKHSTLLKPDSEGYEESLNRWSGAAVRRAGAVLMADSEEDIVTAVKFANENNLEMTVKGGGHSSNGASSTTGGLVIDLSNMRRTWVDLEKKTVSCQGGALWMDVDSAADEHGLATPGGTVGHTGVAGLSLGGGYGYLSAKYGMVIDNMLSARMILADGRIVKASGKENPDLFWAIRGAGHNFGVCVEFEFQAYEQGDVWAGILGFTADKLEPIVNFMNDLTDKNDPLSPALLMISCFPGTFDPFLGVMAFHNGSEESGKKVFQPLLDLGPVHNATRVSSYREANSTLNQSTPHGSRRRIRGSSFEPPLSVEFVQHSIDMLIELATEIPDASKTGLGWEFYNMTKIDEVPITATAFPSRGSQRQSVVMVTWDDPKNDDVCSEWSRRFGRELDKEAAKEKKFDASHVYGNSLDSGSVKVQELFGPNYKRLRKLKGKYDPTNLFHKLHPIEPLIDN